MPRMTPPWWAELLVAIALFAFAAWLVYAPHDSGPPERPPTWMLPAL